MIKQLLEIIDEAAEDIGIWERTTLGLNALESEFQYIDQKIEEHIGPTSLEHLNPKK